MNDILEKAKEYRREIVWRAIAHEDSAEWHRRRGTTIGVAATVLSAVVGSSIFATVTSQLGKENITISRDPLHLTFYFVLGLCMILAPVLTGIQTYLNDQEQADKHRLSSAGYYRIQQRIDFLQLRCRDASTAATSKEVMGELEDISKETEILRRNSITLTNHARSEAETKVKNQIADTMPSHVAAA